MVANFTLALGNSNTQFVVTDASTAAYGGETISSRHIEITDSTGTITTVNFPLITGVGDTVSYDLLTPKAVLINLVIVPASVNPNSTYNKTYSYVTLKPFDNYKQTLEDNIILNIDPTSVLAASTSLIREFEWAQALYDFAQAYSDAGEIASAQKCIDSLIQLSK